MELIVCTAADYLCLTCQASDLKRQEWLLRCIPLACWESLRHAGMSRSYSRTLQGKWVTEVTQLNKTHWWSIDSMSHDIHEPPTCVTISKGIFVLFYSAAIGRDCWWHTEPFKFNCNLNLIWGKPGEFHECSCSFKVNCFVICVILVHKILLPPKTNQCRGCISAEVLGLFLLMFKLLITWQPVIYIPYYCQHLCVLRCSLFPRPLLAVCNSCLLMFHRAHMHISPVLRGCAL